MSYRRHNITSYSLVSLLILSFIPLAQHYGWLQTAKKGVTTNQPGLYSVSRYVDGDTIAVEMNGTPELVRFIGVDTPETHKPNTPVQCYGPAASAYTQNRIKANGGKVRLVSDSLSTNRDRYNRLLRYVYLTDDTNIDLELVAKGYGFAYVSFPFSKSTDFSAAQKNAQTNRFGLWGSCNPHQETHGVWQSNTQ